MSQIDGLIPVIRIIMNIFKWLSLRLGDYHKIDKASKHNLNPAVWKISNEMYHRRFPLRYWFTEEFLWTLGDITDFDTLKGWIYNLCTGSNRVITGLKAGAYHEPRDVMLHSAFSVLVDYVEVEGAYKYAFCHYSTFKFSLWEKFKYCFVKFRNPKFGVNILNDRSANQTLDQVYGETKILELYHWWTVTRQQRINPNTAYDSLYTILENKIENLYTSHPE